MDGKEGDKMIHVMIGGAFGAITRYVLSLLFSKTNVFPWGTFTINLIGSFLLGIVIATMSSESILLFGTGFLGAFTTFSTFSVETMEMLQGKKYVTAIIYIASSLIGIGICFSVGYVLVG